MKLLKQLNQKSLAIVLTVLLSFIISTSHGQKKASIFKKFQKGKSYLPDFSYVGYHNGEKELPNINDYKIFDITTFGAIPNDTISDKFAIQKAISAASKNGSGIVFFPKGRFLVNESTDETNKIFCKGSKIILRGSGSGTDGTELFMKNYLPPTDPNKMWTVPTLFTFTAGGAEKKIGKVISNEKEGSFNLEMDSVEDLKEGDWIVLNVLNNDKELLKNEMGNCEIDPSWTYLINKGIHVKAYYQIKKIENKTLKLFSPISYDINPSYNWEVNKFNNSEEIGIEDIAFVGNWKDRFVHHKSWKDDSGYSMLNFNRITNSWVKNCRFTDCNVGLVLLQSANITVSNCKITGNGGHEAITANVATNILIAKCIDEASQFHSFGTSHESINTVVWKCSYPSTTCFSSHSNQPRNTLIDCVEGGLMTNRAGGATENMPNHMKGLVIWNYKQTNDKISNFEFWPSNISYFKILKPTIVGFVSSGTTFKIDQLGYGESLNKKVKPLSLYEAQLEMRLQKLPKWLND